MSKSPSPPPQAQQDMDVRKFTTRAAAKGDTSEPPRQRAHGPSNHHENHSPLPLYRPSTRKEIWTPPENTRRARGHQHRGMEHGWYEEIFNEQSTRNEVMV